MTLGERKSSAQRARAFVLLLTLAVSARLSLPAVGVGAGLLLLGLVFAREGYVWLSERSTSWTECLLVSAAGAGSSICIAVVQPRGPIALAFILPVVVLVFAATAGLIGLTRRSTSYGAETALAAPLARSSSDVGHAPGLTLGLRALLAGLVIAAVVSRPIYSALLLFGAALTVGLLWKRDSSGLAL